jgi:hypothetical protein
MSFFNKIKSLFNKVVAWFSSMLVKNDSLVKIAAPVAIRVLNIIKNANAEGVTNVIGVIITSVGAKWGTSVAAAVSAWISTHIDKIISGVGMAETAAADADVNTKLRLVSQYISTLDVDVKGVRISQIAAMLARDLDDNHLSVVEIVSIITAIYKTE